MVPARLRRSPGLLVLGAEQLPGVGPRLQARDAPQHAFQVRLRDAGVQELELGPGRHLAGGSQAKAHAHEAGTQQLAPDQVRDQGIEPARPNLDATVMAVRLRGRRVPVAVPVGVWPPALLRVDRLAAHVDSRDAPSSKGVYASAIPVDALDMPCDWMQASPVPRGTARERR